MTDPKTLRYTTTHEWAKLDGDVATVGISQFAVEQLTDLIAIELPKVGATVEQGRTMGEIESVKSVNDLYAPVGGEVVAVNPKLVTGDPKVAPDFQVFHDALYEDGWLIKVKVADPATIADLLDYPAYEKQVADQAH